MTAPSPPPVTFPPNPYVGQIFLNWVWNGSAWVCKGPGPVAINKVLTVSQTYWPGPGLTFATVKCVGGGGGGGGANGSYTGTGSGWVLGGGGGASGGYSESIIAAALLLNGVAVTIGAGGIGGPGTSAGAPGTATSFGSFVVANGGLGGGYASVVGANVLGLGGAQAALGTGDITYRGNGGSHGTNAMYTAGQEMLVPYGGKGGSSQYGGSPQEVYAYPGSSGTIQFQNGLPGYQGSGGGGGASAFSTAAAAGGAGGAGLVIVTEWCFGNSNVIQDCGSAPAVAVPCPPGVTDVPFQQFSQFVTRQW
jgi:hypothetical protein